MTLEEALERIEELENEKVIFKEVVNHMQRACEEYDYNKYSYKQFLDHLRQIAKIAHKIV